MELEVDSKSQSMDITGKVKKFRWRIENFSSITDIKLYSEIFIVDGNKWRILLNPKGIKYLDHLSIYLDVADSATLPFGWSRYAQFGIALIDQIDRKNSILEVSQQVFNANHVDWGFPSFLPQTELHNPNRGYLINDVCLVEAYVSTDRTEGLISHKLIVETDCVKLEPIGITTPSSSPPSCQLVVIEPKDPTEVDMNRFFTSLECEFLSNNIVFTREQAREAMTILDEALNSTPVNFYYPGKFTLLRQAFKILASFDFSSTTLTIEEKQELLGIEERLKELACRATKVVRDKNLLAAKGSVGLTFTCHLECNFIRFKQLEQKLDSLHEQVEGAQKKRENMLVEQKGIYRDSKKMKMELETLRKQWRSYEANAKVAEEEEKIVEVEWGRMKDFISSIKGKI